MLQKLKDIYNKYTNNIEKKKLKKEKKAEINYIRTLLRNSNAIFKEENRF